MKHTVRLAAAAWLAASATTAHLALAQGAAGGASPQASDRALAQATSASADSQISVQSYEDWVREFESRFGQAVGVAREGRTFFSGVANVRVPATDPNYGKEIALAYERAMLDMQADFVLQNYGRQVTRRVLAVLQDASTNAEQFDPVELRQAQEQGRVGRIFDKAIALLDKKLDNELVKEGVPPEKVAQMTVQQKKTVYRENLTKEIITSAVRDMQGLVPVQTRIFTQSTPNGKLTRVGVIAAQSAKTRQFAQDVARQRPSLVKGDPNRLTELLPQSEREYLNEIGLRFSYDEQGRPMLLSYGRWSLSIAKDWTPARAMSATQIATEQARGLAESSMIEFMNTNIQVDRSQTLGNVSEEIARRVTRLDDSGAKAYEQTREQVGETIDKLVRNVRSVAQGSLRGTSVVKRWEQTDENGVMHVGTVLTWTYSQLENAQAIDAKPPAGSGSAQRSGPTQDESRSSRPVNRARDF
jgi:hypothetical protein